MDKVLVTGGLGFIGAYSVCRALLATSRQPVIYDMGSDTSLIRDIAANCIIESGSTGDMVRLMSIVAQHRPQTIAHLAGWTGPQVQQQAWSAINTNLVGTVTVFEAARLSGVSRVVFASSRQVYGPIANKHRHPTYAPVPEYHPREPVKLYGVLKRAGEDIADQYARTYHLDMVGLRSGSAYGPGKLKWSDVKASVVHGIIESAIAGHPYQIDKGADQCDDLCYLGDTANGFIAALDDKPCPGHFRAYNISAGELISLREMISILKDLYPSWSAAAGPGLDYDGTGEEYYFRLSTEKAQTELGFKPCFDFRSAVIDYAATLARLKK